MGFKEVKEKLKWLDPFTYVDVFIMPKLNPKKSETVSWLIYIASAFVFAWLFYTIIGLALGTTSPMVIVLSGSMEPAYHRGDVIVIQGTSAENLSATETLLNEPTLKETALSLIGTPGYSVEGNLMHIETILFNNGQSLEIKKQGDVVVYQSNLLKKPIIHRAVAKLKAEDGWYVLTKGDSENNTTVDQDCGRVIAGIPERNCLSLYPVPIEELQGKAVLWIPIIGCFKLWLVDDLGSLIATGKMPQDFGGIC